MPVAPGTFGTLPGLVLAWYVSGWQGELQIVFVLFFCGLSVWLADRAERIMAVKDPGAIVIDEIAGMLVACGGIALTVPGALILFALFRFFDVIKPFPVGWLDRRLKGGVGIVADDLAAGILANLVYRAGKWLILAV